MANFHNEYHPRILRSNQYRIEDSRFIVQAPRVFKKAKEKELDESSKRVEDLKNEIRSLEEEINQRLEKSEKEAGEIIHKAELEAERIIKEAEKNAFDRVKKSLEEKELAIQGKKEEGEKIVREAKENADKLLKDATDEVNKIREQARKEGFELGRDEGYNEGKNEVISVVERLKAIMHTTIKEREKVLIHSERQIMNLVLTMVKKVVKKITQSDEKIVINNVKEALSLIRGAMMVYIHVSPEDFNIATKHKDELIKMIEGMPEVKFLEDPTVDRGGVYIETDIGEIDARISTQLEEIEGKIKHYVPVKVQGKRGENENLSENIEEGTSDIEMQLLNSK